MSPVIEDAGTDQSVWAEDAAHRMIAEFSDTASIDTASYQLCGFILAAARVVLENETVAARIGALMEPRRA